MRSRSYFNQISKVEYLKTNNNDHTTGVNPSTNKNEDYDVNSELSYELYCYSDEETL
jgi:hypothetical protein